MQNNMKIRVLRDFEIAHDGNNIVRYSEGDTHTLPLAHAQRLLECKAAAEHKEAPAAKRETKVVEPEEVKQEPPHKKKSGGGRKSRK